MDIIGHKHTIDYFDRIIESGNLTHAYLFVGPEHVGKTTVIEYVMRRIIGENAPKNLELHPDVIFVQAEEGKKDISIDQVRTLRGRVSQKPVASPYTLVYIEAVEHLTTAAVNALLKTLEEPTGHTIFFLTTHTQGNVIDTILSRCQKIMLQTVPTADIAQALESQKVKHAQTIARIAHGCPGIALMLSENAEAYADYVASARMFCTMLNAGFATQSTYVEELFPKKKTYTEHQQKAYEYIVQWLEIVHDLLLIKTNFSDRITYEPLKKELEEVSNRYEIQALNNHYQTILEARELLKQGTNPRLVLEQTLLELKV